MGFIIGSLTFVLVVDCIALIFLVLIQLPKKDAGLGLAFGSGAADALFGAGSGNVLTKATRYAATVFFILAMGLGVLQSNYFRASKTEFQRELEKQTKGAGAIALPPTATPEATAPATGTATPAANPAATPPPTGTPSTPASPAPSTPAPATPPPANTTPPK